MTAHGSRAAAFPFTLFASCDTSTVRAALKACTAEAQIKHQKRGLSSEVWYYCVKKQESVNNIYRIEKQKSLIKCYKTSQSNKTSSTRESFHKEKALG